MRSCPPRSASRQPSHRRPARKGAMRHRACNDRKTITGCVHQCSGGRGGCSGTVQSVVVVRLRTLDLIPSLSFNLHNTKWLKMALVLPVSSSFYYVAWPPESALWSTAPHRSVVCLRCPRLCGRLRARHADAALLGKFVFSGGMTS